MQEVPILTPEELCARDGGLSGSGRGGGVEGWRRSLGECGVACVMGLLRDCSDGSHQWSREQVLKLLALLVQKEIALLVQQ